MSIENDNDDEFVRGSFEWEPPRPPCRPSLSAGYGCPPVEHRWRPGTSGNPAGRPRKKKNVEPSPNLMAAWTEEMAERHTVMLKGKSVSLTTDQIIAKRLKADLLGDDPDVRWKAMSLLHKMGLGDAVSALQERLAEENERRERDIAEFLRRSDSIVAEMEREIADDTSGYEFALAATSCTCGAMKPWYEGQSDIVKSYERLHAAELDLNAAGEGRSPPTEAEPTEGSRDTGPHKDE